MEYVYYKRNVGFPIVVRENLRDNIGTLLTDSNPYVAVEKEKLRDFINSNKEALTEGKIIEIPEPALDIITPNAITDEDALLLVKNYFDLRKKLPEITSETALQKLLYTARAEHRPVKTIELIVDRLEEVSPTVMEGIEDS